MYFCGLFYAATIMVTVVIYAIWSFKFTEYRTPFRIAMNKVSSNLLEILNNYDFFYEIFRQILKLVIVLLIRCLTMKL